MPLVHFFSARFGRIETVHVIAIALVVGSIVALGRQSLKQTFV
jgi:hypothetical protein